SSGSTMDGCPVLRAGPQRPAVKAEIAGLTGVEPASAISPRATPATAVFPAHYPLFAVLPPAMRQARPATPKQQRPRIHPADWPRIAERARYESLRDLAAEYGVSHETIRAVVRRASGSHLAGLAAD